RADQSRSTPRVIDGHARVRLHRFEIHEQVRPFDEIERRIGQCQQRRDVRRHAHAAPRSIISVYWMMSSTCWTLELTAVSRNFHCEPGFRYFRFVSWTIGAYSAV